MSLERAFPNAPGLTPEQVKSDAASRTAFRGLGRDAVMSLAEQDFHVERPAWTPPGSEQGARLESFLGENSAVEKFPGGGHDVVSSNFPLRVDDGSGLAAVSLALRDDGEAFVPGNPLVPVAISKAVSGGIAFPAGLSVAAVSVGASEGPVVVGNRVVFANVARDTDLLAEPRPGGAEVSWLLRSQESPVDEALRFGLPAGAVLRSSTSVPGGVEVMQEGKQLLLVPPALAKGADGASVPVSYSVSGSVLMVHVDLTGNVAFPVMVDPSLFYGYYGARNGANVWSGWTHSSNWGTPVFEEQFNLLKLGTNPGASLGSSGGLTSAAPGPSGKSGSAGITRVDVTGVINGVKGQSRLIGTINESNGTAPVYSYNGTGGASGPLPLYEEKELANQAIAFCASGAGGHDGGEQPLCDEEHYQGRSFLLEDEITGTPQNHFNWIQLEGAQITYRDPAAPNKVVLSHPGYEGQWLKTGPTNFKIEAEDEGLGLAHFELQIPAGASPTFKQDVNCNSQNGFTGCPNTYTSEAINLSGVNKTGELSLAPVAVDAAENVSRPSGSYVPLFLDQVPPEIALSGSLYVGAGVRGDGNYTLGFNAIDGSKGSPQSGTRSVEVKVDGRQVYSANTACGSPKGVPAEGCFAMSGSLTVNGQAYGAGTHTVTVVAKDWVGNESTKSFNVTFNEAAYQPLGPGAVNVETGDYRLSATDVSLSGGAASLAVSRTFDSRNASQGASGPLGPEWELSLPDSAAGGEWQSLTPLAEGSLDLVSAHGNQVVFSPKSGGGYISPASYQADTVTEPSTSPVEYQIADSAGDYTRFAQPSGGGPFVPSSVVQASAAGGLNKVKYTFTRTAEGVTEPTQVLGPEPSGGACTSSLVKGCRALTFNYASSTTATGEGPSEWGDYKARLTRVYLTAWDPAKGEMTTTTVAQIAYDKQGRLRAEWDPRLTTPLKTTYGYDSENHITAVEAPGQQPWLLHYGTLAGDSNAGRVLSATRPPAETALWKGEALKNTVLPALSGPAETGVKMSVTTGTWSGGALAFAYQWEDCNASGGECTPILGATNAAYTPAPGDLGHTLVAQVAATNAGGSVLASSAHSASVSEVKATYAAQFGSLGSGNGQLKSPRDVVRDSKGNLWVVDSGNSRVEVFNEKDEFVKVFGGEGTGNGQLKGPSALAIDSKGNVWVTDTSNSRVEEFNEKGEFVRVFGSQGVANGKFEYPNGIAVDPKGNVWVVDTLNYRVQVFNEKGEFVKAFGSSGSGAGQFGRANGIALDAHGNAWIADAEDKRIIEFNEKGEYVKAFGVLGKGPGEFQLPRGVAVDGEGHVWVADGENERVDEFNEKGEYIGEAGSKGSGVGQFNFDAMPALVGIATDSKHDVWVDDGENNRIQRWTAPTLSEGETPPAPGPRWTIEYQVPLSGPTAPYALGSKEVEAWAQKDDPTEATAIFPPDEVQSWPATDYKRANIFYIDGAGRSVNTASPSGAITISEYNLNNNNLERTLSAADRSKALEAGGKSAEESTQLDTESSYSGDGSELTSTLGPRHTVKLSNGSEAAARKRTQYFYDEGAPGGETYRLVTKTIEGAQIAGQEEKDKRTVTTSYSGQENLGWKLHAPTSTTTSTGSATLVSSSSYEPTTGEVKETQPATRLGGNPAVYVSQFGSVGAGNGQFREPVGVAVDAKGNLWVLDSGNSRVEEFNEKGEYVQKFGSEGQGNGQLLYPAGIAVDSKSNVWVVEGNNDRVQEFNEKGEYLKKFGSIGSGNGQFSGPLGIAIDAKGNVWVADTGNSRVQEFNEKGEYQKAFGSKGSASGQMSSPEGVTIDPHGNVWVADKGNNRVDVFNEKGEYTQEFGSEGTGSGQFKSPGGIASDSHGDIWVGDYGNSRVEELNEDGEYLGTFGSKGSAAGQFSFLSALVGITGDSKHDLWVADSGNNRIEKWTTPNAPVGRLAARNTQTIYYTAAANPTYPGCGNHPEWASLPCQGQHAAQPESGLPNLPVTTYTYNVWNEPLTTTDTVGTTTRTTTITYDPAGRTLTSAISSSVDTPLPTVTDEYSTETGALVKQSTTSEGKTKSLTSEYNKLGQITTYTDADSNAATYEYEKEKDYRLLKSSDGKGTQTYSYDPTTGELTTLKDSAAGTFTAAYDLEGNITTEGYPNGMNANYTHNPLGQPTNLEYIKTTHCTSGCTWYSDTVTPSIHGQWLAQTSSLSKQSYAYDEIGRLTEVQDTPAGKGCTTRLYAYDEDGNRTSQTSREPGNEGKCAGEGGTTQTSAYDTADRLDETGVTYETWGNTTSLPAADAGGSTLTSSYYVNNTLASQEQNGQTINYKLDPASRTRETISTGTIKSTVTSHYASAGDSPAWTANATNWTRNITSIAGGLGAIQTNGGTPILQLANLHGDIIATAALSETETKLLSTSDTTEYGVPRTSTPPKYNWLGSDQRPTELPSGLIDMGARGYIPQLGRFEQTDPQPGGSINAYAYTHDDPVNQADPSGEYANTVSYNYGAAETGQAQSGLAEQYSGPGAITPPPVNMQIEEEFVAHPPWLAASAFDAEQNMEYGGGARGLTARAAAYKKNPCAEQHDRNKARNCRKESENQPMSPAEKCILAAGGGLLISWIPGVDVGGDEAAIAACGAALGSSPGEMTGESNDDK
jgi:RHS repeat-associated protein